jgi:hypothetical protein
MSLRSRFEHDDIAFELADADGGTALRLVVERFATETIFRHLDLYWRGTLHVLKTFVERSPPFLPHVGPIMHP